MKLFPYNRIYHKQQKKVFSHIFSLNKGVISFVLLLVISSVASAQALRPNQLTSVQEDAKNVIESEYIANQLPSLKRYEPVRKPLSSYVRGASAQRKIAVPTGVSSFEEQRKKARDNGYDIILNVTEPSQTVSVSPILESFGYKKEQAQEQTEQISLQKLQPRPLESSKGVSAACEAKLAALDPVKRAKLGVIIGEACPTLSSN